MRHSHSHDVIPISSPKAISITMGFPWEIPTAMHTSNCKALSCSVIYYVLRRPTTAGKSSCTAEHLLPQGHLTDCWSASSQKFINDSVPSLVLNSLNSRSIRGRP